MLSGDALLAKNLWSLIEAKSLFSFLFFRILRDRIYSISTSSSLRFINVTWYFVMLLWMVIEVSLLQPENAKSSMLLTLSGMVTDVRPKQPENAEDPMLVTLFGMVTDVSPLQRKNAASPMLVTLFGMVTDVSPLQPKNALSPMFVTLLGIIVVLHPAIIVFDAVSITALQSLRESYTLLPLETFIFVSPLQSANA